MGGAIGSAEQWTALRRALRLIRDNVDVQRMDDVAYVSSGYAPMTARLVELAASSGGGWASSASSDVLRLLPGACLTFAQVPDGVGSRPEELHEIVARQAQEGQSRRREGKTNLAETTRGDSGRDQQAKKLMLVFVVGGITYMEIAALRHLSDSPNCEYRKLALLLDWMSNRSLPARSAVPFQILIGTTKVTNGSALLQSLMPKLSNRLEKG